MTRGSPKIHRPTVVHAINNLGVGGAETMCLEVLRHFSAWADNAVIVLDAQHQPRRAEFEQLDIPITTLNHAPGQYLQLVYKSYRYFRQHPTDALICWSFGNHTWLSLGAKLAGVTHVIASVQNAPPDEPDLRSKWRSLARLSFWTTSHLVACSNYVRDRLVDDLNLPAHRIVTICNGCNVRHIHQRAQAGKAVKPLHPIIGMVARLNEIKDQKTLIQAMPLVLAQHPTAELWLVGSGEQQPRLETWVKDLGLTAHVKFWGDRQDVPELLGQMDVFAFSTTAAEGLPVALIEALAVGIPIVASHVGPCAEVLQQGKWGTLVEPANPTQLGRAILRNLAGHRCLSEVTKIWSTYDTKSAAQTYWKLLFQH